MASTFRSEKKGFLLLATAFLGVMLVSTPLGVSAQPLTVGGGAHVSIINGTPSTVFKANLSTINGTISYNFVGNGGNDTFILAAGNASLNFLATGLRNNTFIINSTGAGNSTFGLTSGANSTFIIVEGNLNGTTGTQVFAITGGANCRLNETSIGPVGNALWSVNLGTNSTVSLGSIFAGNQTAINILT